MISIRLPHLLILVAALSSALSAPAREMKALLVGVSEYPTLAKRLQLEGPRNDVVRMREVLLRRGFSESSIKVLADGVPDAGLPTRNAILGELEKLAQNAAKDDVIFLYFAGHGSQQPVAENNASESDRLDEIFLPRDVGQWSIDLKSVKNAIIKTDLRAAVDRMLAKGAFVWGVFDSCHSATLVRGSGGVRFRSVEPAVLGVPASPKPPSTAADTQAAVVAESNVPVAGSVFFYAAQTRESTPEMPMPLGRVDAKPYGLFGFTVMDALDSGVPMTYRQMAQYVLTRYGAQNESRVTPLFTGSALDQPVLQQNAPTVMQWALEGFDANTASLNAGALSRLHEGDIVAVVKDPIAKTESAMAYLKLTQVNLTTSLAVPVEFNSKPALAVGEIPKGSFARVIRAAPDYALRVAVDMSECPNRCMPWEVVNERRIRGVEGVAVTWVDTQASADIILKLLPDRIQLLPPSLVGVDCSKAGSGCGNLVEVVADQRLHPFDGGLRRTFPEALHAVARSTNLLRLSSSSVVEGKAPSALSVDLLLIGKDGKTQPYQAGQVPRIKAGDVLSVTLKNNGFSAVDATLLYLDAHYGIGVMFPQTPGASNRLEAGAETHLEIDMSDDTVGLERLLVIAVNAAKSQERADFSFLAQPALSSVLKDQPENTKGIDDPDVLAFLDAGFASYLTRSVTRSPKAPNSRTSLQVFTLEIVK